MDETLLSWQQALQLLALGPCLFMLFFLCVAGRKFSQILVPLLYFLGLTCSFLLPLRDLLGAGDGLYAVLLAGANLTPAISFLLIVQFMSGHPPRLLYWSVLAVPLIGGGQFVHAMVITQSDVCIYDRMCTDTVQFGALYRIVTTSFIFLLSVVMYRRLGRAAEASAVGQLREKHALVLALIILNLALLGLDLAQASGFTDLEHARFAKTFVRIGFIYLALTLIFRIFDRSVDIAYERVPSIKPQEPSARDNELAERLRQLFSTEKLYRDTELGREKLARKLAVTEGTLSRIVNTCFHENVSMLVNRYRVEEAKERLKAENVPVTTIAFDVGFSSIPSFNRVFKQLTGYSPSECRSAAAVEKK